MELFDAMQSQGTCRSFRPDPVPDELLLRAFAIARFAPSGGNRQPVRWVVVRDRAVKTQLRDWYRKPWAAYMRAVREGRKAIQGSERTVAALDHFAEHLDEVPVIVVVCADLGAITATDTGLDRVNIVPGGSIYPTVQNFLLACRQEGLGTALTTLLCSVEPQVQELLGIPPGFATAAHIAVGYPTRPFPTRLRRAPVEEIVFSERFGDPLVPGPR
jgi:nitroreductase